MIAFLRKALNRLHDRLWLAPRGFNPGYGEAFWNEGFAAGKWDHLSAIPESARYALIRNYALKLRPGGRVLDVGCGNGVLKGYFEGSEVAGYTGLDLSPEAIGLAGPNGDFRVADFETFVAGPEYDIIVFNEALTYARDPGVTFRRYWAGLPSGGIVIVSICDYDVRNRANWKRFEPDFKARHSSRLVNELGQAWDIKAFVKP